MRPEGKVAVVAGAGYGTGKAAAELFGNAGFGGPIVALSEQTEESFDRVVVASADHPVPPPGARVPDQPMARWGPVTGGY